MVFWDTVANTFLFALTVTTPSALVGIGLFIVSFSLVVKSYTKMVECADEFKSFERLNEEDTREKSLISFFKPAESLPERKVDIQETIIDMPLCC
ncbi:MAG: hypothetical protein ACRCXC_10145 [Legionella sp.]